MMAFLSKVLVIRSAKDDYVGRKAWPEIACKLKP